MRIILVVFLLLLASVHASWAVGNLPTVKTSEERLLDEIDKMIQAGSLRPAYYTANEFYWQRAEGILVHEVMSHYWANPADTTYTLIRALPHMPDTPYPKDPSKTWRQKLREYIKSEWQKTPVSLYTHTGWANRTPREIFDIDPQRNPHPITSSAGFSYGKLHPGNYDASATNPKWKGWTFNPYNFYVAWKYADTFKNEDPTLPTTILNQMRSKISVHQNLDSDPNNNIVEPYPNFPNQDYLLNRPHVLNAYIAGYIGYLGLQDLAGEPRNAQVEIWLTAAKQKRLDQLSQIDPWEIDGTESGGFLWLVPELGDYLFQNAKPHVHKYVYGTMSLKGYDYLMPYWFVSRVDEATRVHDFSVNQRHEGSTSQYYDYSSLFNAKALALKESRTELEKYLDVPAVERGDLFYIQNLVSAIEAGGTTNPTPTSSGPTPTSTQLRTGIKGGTGDGSLPASQFSFPVVEPLLSQIITLTRDAVTEAKIAYGSGLPSVILVAHNLGLSTEITDEIASQFPNVPIVGTTTSNVNYNGMTEDVFVEHNNRSISMLALGGNDIKNVVASGLHPISGGNMIINVQAGERIASDLASSIDPSKTNIVVLFGPGHNPNHKFILCGFKQRLAGVSEKCATTSTTEPEAPDLPQPPAHIKIIGASSYFEGSSIVDQQTVRNTAVGVLINGAFMTSVKGYSGAPTTTTAASTVQSVVTELGGTLDVLFYVPGHPTVGTYKAVHDSVVDVLAADTPLWGHEGGGEWGHMTTADKPIAVPNHLFVMGLKGSGGSVDVNEDGVVDVEDVQIAISHWGQLHALFSQGDVNGDTMVNALDIGLIFSAIEDPPTNT